MSRVGWLVLSEAALPDDDDWLAAPERARLEALRFPRRRRDWRLGRWTARAALRACPGAWRAACPVDELSILPDADGAPHVRDVRGQEPCALSLSHRDGWALCVVAEPGVRVGCDLERVEPRSERFVADYFTRAERERWAAAGAARDVLANAIWAAKESAVKLLGTGWRVDTRCAEVTSLAEGGAGWRPLRVRVPETVLAGWWRVDGARIAAAVASPAPEVPEPLAGA